MTRPIWQLLTSQAGEAGKLSCEECIQVLDYYVDQVTAPEDTPELRSSIARHLSHCSQCRLELEKRLNEWERLGREQPRSN